MGDHPELILSASQARGELEQPVDIARFGRVVTWDPNRTDGARATRTEEFRAEDLFLDTEVPKQADGSYQVPVSSNGLGCIGLQWLNRRALKALTLEFPPGVQAPPTDAVQVQGWFGESAWQGNWKTLTGKIEATGHGLLFHLAPEAGLLQTRKVRWVFPATSQTVVRSLRAFTRSRWQTVKLLVEAEKPAKGARGELLIYNGELLSASSSRRKEALTKSSNLHTPLPRTLPLHLTRPLHLLIRASRPSPFKSDPTILQFRLPSGGFGVAVEDVLSNKCVYLPDYGIFVARDPAPITLAGYKREIARCKNILQQVREMPDQTFAQAMARTHHEAQREGPAMLSLACDNTKFVLERDGTLRFQAATNTTGNWYATAGEIQPRFGVGPAAGLTRRLDGGWLPIPVITVKNQGILYRQRTFVAPSDEAGSNPARLNRLSVCVMEFTVTNTLALPGEAALSLHLLADSQRKQLATLTRTSSGYSAAGAAGTFALAETASAQPLTVAAKDGELTLTGLLASHRSASFRVLLPSPGNDFATLPEPASLRAVTEAYWQTVLAPAMQVQTPDPLLNNVIRSSQVRCLIAARNEAGGARIAPWISAMSYGPLESEANSVIRGMDFLGHREFARRGLDFFIHRYNTNGFLTTGYTTFGTAWHLWTLGQHYQLYRETDWLRKVAPEIECVTDWIIRQTDKTKRPGRPESGLMPPGVLADWNSFAYHYTMNAYYYAALREVGTVPADLPPPRAPDVTRLQLKIPPFARRASPLSTPRTSVRTSSAPTAGPKPRLRPCRCATAPGSLTTHHRSTAQASSPTFSPARMPAAVGATMSSWARTNSSPPVSSIRATAKSSG